MQLCTLTGHYITLPIFSLEGVNHIGGVMVSVIASRELDCGFQPRLCQSKDLTLAFATAQLNTQH
jgi:hypothetical protein